MLGDVCAVFVVVCGHACLCFVCGLYVVGLFGFGCAVVHIGCVVVDGGFVELFGAGVECLGIDLYDGRCLFL